MMVSWTCWSVDTMTCGHGDGQVLGSEKYERGRLCMFSEGGGAGKEG